MISSLYGKIEYKNEKSVILEVNGVGYEIFCSSKTLIQIENGQEIKIFTHLCLKKETFELYGFLTFKELEFFKILNNISGIGVKSALNLTSFGSLERLKEVVEKQEFIPELKGIGKKRLQKIVFEISNQITNLKGKEFTPEEKTIFEALVSLGFPSPQAREALKHLSPDIKEIEEKIKSCLHFLQK